MREERPFGSRDWNNNGEYDFFDKVTDRYVYDKVTNYKPEPKPPKFKKSYDNSSTESTDLEIFIGLIILIIIFILVGTGIGGIIMLLMDII